MFPYPAGVYVDPQGQLQHRRVLEGFPAESFNPSAAADALRHPWRTASPRRVISLRRLDRQVGELTASGLAIHPELQYLAALSRIDLVVIDAAQEDLWLIGPAGGGPPGFFLQDLTLLTAVVNAHTSPLGCSIDPTDAGILAAQRTLTTANALRRLELNPAKFVEQMQAKVGPHRITVFGLPANCPTALALVAADEHMKQLGFGQNNTAVSINSYFDFLEQQSSIPKQSLVRWWFSYADNPIELNSDGNQFKLPAQCVALRSEQQWASQLGRAASGAQDPAADRFAEELTAKLVELRGVHPIYARLCAVFETALTLQLALESSGQPSWQAWFPNLIALGKHDYDEFPAPETVSGLAAWHKLPDGTVVAVVSGGVQINSLTSIAKQVRRTTSDFVPIPATPQTSPISHGSWWWD